MTQGRDLRLHSGQRHVVLQLADEDLGELVTAAEVGDVLEAVLGHALVDVVYGGHVDPPLAGAVGGLRRLEVGVRCLL